MKEIIIRTFEGEDDVEEIVLLKGNDRHERYLKTKKSNERKDKIPVIKKLHARKAEIDTPWLIQYENGKTVPISDEALWKNQGKQRREGKAVCRNYVEDNSKYIEEYVFDYYEGYTFPEREDGTIDLDAIPDDDEEYDYYYDDDYDDDDEYEDEKYFITHRYWSNEINDHVYETYPNYEYAEQFLREIGLEDKFINWLKNKEKLALTRKLCR